MKTIHLHREGAGFRVGGLPDGKTLKLDSVEQLDRFLEKIDRCDCVLSIKGSTR